MEVPGKTISTDENNTLCNICEDDDKVTHADGFCEECEEYMCSTCFDKHKKRKISRHHEFTDLNEVQSLQENKGSDNLEKCKLHCNEVVKFYCSHHEKIGCGDCMIFEHKSCRVEYIRDKARQFKDSQDYKDLIRRAEKCHLEAEEMFTSLKSNKIQVVDIHDKFTRDINAFKEEMIVHVTKLTNDMLKQGEDIKAMDMKSIDKLEKETEGVMNETSRLSDVFVSHSDRPQKLFVSSVLQKPKLNGLREQLDNIKGKNKISVYEFSCDGNLERSVKDCKQLGNMQTIKQSNKADIKEKVRPKEIAQHVPVPVLPKPQPLLDRQLICRNIAVDGEYLSYADSGNGDVGLFVDKESVCKGRYFEVEILSLGQRGTIAIGLVPRDYPENHQPGWEEGSIGYHADDGMLYDGSGTGKKFGPKCSVGDRAFWQLFDNCVYKERN